jgi:hypothetical protein
MTPWVVEYCVYIFFQKETLGRILSYTGKVSGTVSASAVYNGITTSRIDKESILYCKFFMGSDISLPKTGAIHHE